MQKSRKRKKMQISLIWCRFFKRREIYSFLPGEMQIFPTSALSHRAEESAPNSLTAFSVSNDPSAVPRVQNKHSKATAQ